MKEMYKSSRIMVTGARGFLGSHVVEELIAKGYDKSNIIMPRHKDYDMTREVDVERMYDELKPDVVIHIAADIGGIGYSRENPGKQLYNNTMMNLLVQDRACRAGCKKFVGIGSVCAYPKFTKVPFVEEDLWEGYPEETNAAYGLSKKIMMEQSIAYKNQYGFNGIHLLMINLYGPRDNFDMASSHVIPALIQKIEAAIENNDPSITLWGDGTPTREFLFIEDAAKAIVLAMEEYDSPNPVNIGTGNEISIKDLAETLKDILGYKGNLVYDTSKPNGQPKRRLNVEKAKKYFGFTSSINFREGLEKTIVWWKANKEKMDEEYK